MQADTISRYRCLKGEDVVFQSGTDENSLKTIQAAKKRGVSVQSHVFEHAELYKELSARLNITIHQFVQTSSDHHRTIVRNFWRSLNPEDIYRKGYGGLYCVGCEDFLTDSDLVSGKCPDHLKAPEFIEEDNYFFRLSKYQQQLIDLIESGRIRLVPAFRKKEILNFIKGGLEDISVSRDQSRSEGWGIPVPDDESQIIYVWIDALINYVSGCSDDERGFARIWSSNAEKIHFIGKNVWKFHAIYWPAILLSAGLPLPNEIVIHGFLTVDGKKISKSLGNAIDPLEVIDAFSGDTLRFYLLRCCSPFEDSDFSLAALTSAHNTYLVNGLGNLVSRLRTLAVKSEVLAFATAATVDSL